MEIAIIAGIGIAIAVAFFVLRGRGKKSSPQPPPQPLPPSPEPTPPPPPAPTPTPTPEWKPPTLVRVEVPNVDISNWIRRQGGAHGVHTVISAVTGDLSEEIRQAQNVMGGPGVITVRGGGEFRTPLIVTHDLVFEPGTYLCETQEIWRGTLLLSNNVMVEGGPGVVFYEPYYTQDGYPSLTVFQALAGSIANENASENITVKGIKIVGRQKLTDGGVRQSISFGNTKNAAAIDCTLENVASIGIQFGGGAAGGNHAENCLAVGNHISGAVAAAIAIVNARDVWVFDNVITKPGRVGGPGGVSAVDIETNNTDDWAENIKIYDNLCDYSEAAFLGAGSAILAQNAYNTERTLGLFIANNRITGGPSAIPYQGLSNGIYFTNSFPGAQILSNDIYNAKQCGIQLYGSSRANFIGNHVRDCGGGGIGAVTLIGGFENRFKDNFVSAIPKQSPDEQVLNTWPIFREVQDSRDNIYEGNTTWGGGPVPLEKG